MGNVTFFTARQVKAIRKQYAEGNTITSIAKAYGRERHAIADLVHGRTYAWVRDDVDAPALPGQVHQERRDLLERKRDTADQKRVAAIPSGKSFVQMVLEQELAKKAQAKATERKALPDYLKPPSERGGGH